LGRLSCPAGETCDPATGNCVTDMIVYVPTYDPGGDSGTQLRAGQVDGGDGSVAVDSTIEANAGDGSNGGADGSVTTCGSSPADAGHLPWLPCILNTVPSTAYLTVSGFSTCSCFNGTFALTQEPAPNGTLWTSQPITGCPGQANPAYFKFWHLGVNTTTGVEPEVVGITDVSSTPGSANTDESFASGGTCSPLWLTGSGTTVGNDLAFCSASEDKNMSWTLSDSLGASAPPAPPSVTMIPTNLNLTVSGFKMCSCFNGTFPLAQIPDSQDPTGSLWTSQAINGCPGQTTTAYLKFKVGTANGTVGAGITDQASDPGTGNGALSGPTGGTWCPLSVTGGPLTQGNIAAFCGSAEELDMAWTLTGQ
jgi:hypothetical protein